MYSAAQLEELARKNGAWCDETHVILPNWDHSSGFFSHLNLISSAKFQDLFASALADKARAFEKESDREIQVLVGPLEEGGLWGGPIQKSLQLLDRMRELRFLFTRAQGENQIFRVDHDSGWKDEDLVRGRTVAIINDVLSTGVSVGPITKVIREAGGEPVVILSLCDRRPDKNKPDGLEVISLFQVNWPVWKPDECPLCPAIPINPNLGYGARYFELHRLMGSVSYQSLGER